MSAQVLTVNVGSAEPNPAKDAGVTGFGKVPVEVATLRAPGPKRGGLGSGVVGDFIGDVQSHGGDRQAVYAFAREELDRWEDRLGMALPNGAFGENLTMQGLDVDASHIGDRWAVADEVVLEVSGPRLPCVTFAARMGVRGWLRTFSEQARSGAYLAIVTGGEIRPGDAVEVVHRETHGIDVPTAYRAFFGDLDAAERVLAADCLPEDEQAWLRDRVARRGRKPA